MDEHHLRYLRPHNHLGSTFGDDPFGRFAERVARIFGTPQYIVGQTIVVVVWIIFNGYELLVHFDPYPFILLNLAFSLQAAYAAPLILLAETRQAARDKAHSEADAHHREEIAHQGLAVSDQLRTLLESNTELTAETKRLAEQVEALTRQIHGRVCV
jgi:uncharacterized membrane protein